MVGASVSFASQCATYGLNEVNGLQVAIDGLFSLGSMALATSGIGLAASVLIGGGFGIAQYFVGSSLHNESTTLHGLGFSTISGMISGYFSGAGARNINNIISKIQLSGNGATAVNAIQTALSKYLAGKISYRGFVGTTNLYGKIAYSALDAAIDSAIRSITLDGAIAINIATASIAFANYLINKIIELLTE